jgi:hypothetical protein
MPSKNSYAYYGRFLKCLRLYLKRKVDDRKKEKYIDEPEIIHKWIEYEGENKGVDLTIDSISAAFEYVFDEFIKKAPSACMGANDWFDEFLASADSLLCPGIWCGNPHCKHNDNCYPYNCAGGNLPYKCKIWKNWRNMWRSYPEKKECHKCRYYKPEKPYKCPMNDKAAINRIYERNKYKCYCRAKELPENCPKRTLFKKGKGEDDAAE